MALLNVYLNVVEACLSFLQYVAAVLSWIWAWVNCAVRGNLYGPLTKVAASGTNPAPPKTVALVIAETEPQHIEEQRVLELLLWCSEAGLQRVHVYDPAGHIKSQHERLGHALAAQFAQQQAGDAAQPGHANAPAGIQELANCSTQLSKSCGSVCHDACVNGSTELAAAQRTAQPEARGGWLSHWGLRRRGVSQHYRNDKHADGHSTSTVACAAHYQPAAREEPSTCTADAKCHHACSNAQGCRPGQGGHACTSRVPPITVHVGWGSGGTAGPTSTTQQAGTTQHAAAAAAPTTLQSQNQPATPGPNETSTVTLSQTAAAAGQAAQGLHVHLLSAQDGWEPLLRVARKGAAAVESGDHPLKAAGRNHKDAVAALQMEMVGCGGPSAAHDPDLILVYSRGTHSLAGYPPLNTHSAEILRMGPLVRATRDALRHALGRYARTRQRWGR